MARFSSNEAVILNGMGVDPADTFTICKPPDLNVALCRAKGYRWGAYDAKSAEGVRQQKRYAANKQQGLLKSAKIGVFKQDRGKLCPCKPQTKKVCIRPFGATLPVDKKECAEPDGEPNLCEGCNTKLRDGPCDCGFSQPDKVICPCHEFN